MGSFVRNLKKGLNEPEEIDVTPKKPEAAKEEKAAK
jgi:hypothetical protein